MRFIDEIDISVASGSGGDGCVSFRREKYVPRGGPDGGDGGRGGAVILEATRQRNTLVDFRRNRVYRARDGEPGRGNQQYGKGAADLVLLVPVGTVVYDDDTDAVLADLAEEGARWTVAGGRGGLGNMHFATATHRTPEESTPGEAGTEVRLHLELKLIADVGLLGFPNAGKSTLISRISAARPRVADYPFTTLTPSLGVVEIEPGTSFVVADIPGLIEGAAEGVGLGHRFLKHVERCAVLAHLVSANPFETLDPVARYHAIRGELEQYDPALAERPQVVLLSQTDLVDDDTRRALCAALAEAAGSEVIPVSAATGAGLQDVVRALWTWVAADREGS